jgi:hypothetical protein
MVADSKSRRIGFFFRKLDVIRRASVLQSLNLSLLSAAHNLNSEMQDIDENALFCGTPSVEGRKEI